MKVFFSNVSSLEPEVKSYEPEKATGSQTVYMCSTS